MWPWEHAVIGYLAFSIAVHLVAGRSPTGLEAITVVFASVLPDLIDKPLAWEFGVFPSGYGLGHSVFFVVPLVIVVLVAAVVRDRIGVGSAFAVGYLLHLPADIVPGYLRTGGWPIARVLWPVETIETNYPGGFSGTFIDYFRGYLASFVTTDPSGYVIGVGLITGACALLWVYDGLPGLREPVQYLWRRWTDGRMHPL